MENGENMIEKISFYLAKKIYICSEANNLCVADEENEDIQVLQYGIECIINMSIPFIVIFGYAWYFKMLMPMIIWMTMFLSLRNYIGGYHANSHFQCILYSIVYIIDLTKHQNKTSFLLNGHKHPTCLKRQVM